MELIQERSDVMEMLKNIARDQEIEDFVIEDVTTNSKGEGFLGDICFVTLKDKASGRIFDLVMKLAFREDNIRSHFPIKECFENEVLTYSHILVEYKKLLEEVGNETVFTAKCFQTSLLENQELLVFENLKKSGFELFDKKSALDHNHVNFIFKTYGTLHGLSFVLQKLKPEEHEEITKKTHNIFALMKDTFKRSLDVCKDFVSEALIPGEDDDIIEAFNKFKEDDDFDICKAASRESKYSIITHGDCWSNNMMFKYEKKELVDLRLLDFQLTKKGSPVCDLSYFFYSGGSKEVFDRLDDYLRIYHQSLSSLLKQFALNAEEIFPFESLKQEWKEFAKFGFLMGIILLRMKFTNSEDIVVLKDINFDDQPKTKTPKFDVDKFNQRVREILKHLCEIGVLN